MKNCKFCNNNINESNDVYVTLHYDSFIVINDKSVKFGDADTPICKTCAIKKGLLPDKSAIDRLIRLSQSNLPPHLMYNEAKNILNIR